MRKIIAAIVAALSVAAATGALAPAASAYTYLYPPNQTGGGANG